MRNREIGLAETWLWRIGFALFLLAPWLPPNVGN